MARWRAFLWQVSARSAHSLSLLGIVCLVLTHLPIKSLANPFFVGRFNGLLGGPLDQSSFALYWNPAGIVNIGRPMAHFYHSPWIADVQFNHSAVVTPLDRSSSIGFFITSVTMDEMQVRTVKSPEGTGDYYSANDFAASVSYGKRMVDLFAFGASFKYI